MKYKTRPIIVDAWQHSKDKKPLTVILPGWVLEGMLDGTLAPNGGIIKVKTVTGYETAEDQDWIIRGEKSEMSVLKPDVFAFRYEKMPNAS